MKKILIVNEASYLSSGFANYGRELISRLVRTNKYKIAELGNYGHVNDPREHDVIKWRFYANAVQPNDPRFSRYQERPDNQWGNWRFDNVLLDFKPDIVVSWADPWMFMYQMRTPLYRYFHHVIMPTVDSAPQREQWLEYFSRATKILTYSWWGMEVLKQQGGKWFENKLHKPAPFGVEEEMKPLSSFEEKEEHKAKYGLKGKRVLGTVMRNQPRKLYPDLFAAFKKYLDKVDPEIEKQSVLLCHTSYPDRGWNIPRLLQEYGITHRVMFTYYCDKGANGCGHIHVSYWHGAKKHCPSCGKNVCKLPNVSGGVSRKQLRDIYRLMDLYVQYANCLAKDQEIFTHKGWTKIQDVKVGDYAWTHKNRWQKVTDTWVNLEKSKNSKMLEIQCHAEYETLKATSDHEFPAYTSSEFSGKRSVREQIGDALRSKKDLPEMGRYSLDELQSGDMLAFPIDDIVCDKTEIDLAPYAGINDLILESLIEVKYGNTYPRYIDVDNEFCKFLGLYVADGSSSVTTGKYLKITSNKNEKENIDVAASTIQKIGSKDSTIVTRNYKDREGIDTFLCSSIHSSLFLSMCKKHEKKCFPDWAMYLPLEKQRNILQGLFMGDGCNSKGICVYATISKKLAEQIKHLLRRQRINFNCHTSKKEGNRKLQYRFEVAGYIKNGEFKVKRNNSRSFYYKNHHYVQIKSITEVDYNEDVYCITVDKDHTMTTRLGSTFQCEGFGLPVVEAASCGVKISCTDATAMRDFEHRLLAYPITPLKMHLSVGEDAYRAIPNNKLAAHVFQKFLTKTPEEMFAAGQKTAELARKNYNYDDITQTWMDCFDSLEPLNLWDSAPLVTRNNVDLPENLEHNTLIREAAKISGYPFDHTSYQGLSMVRDLDNGMSIGPEGIRGFGPKDVMQIYNTFSVGTNIAEEVRVGMRQLNNEDYLEYAKMKEEIYSND
jgi:intein/homing endonuclease